MDSFLGKNLAAPGLRARPHFVGRDAGGAASLSTSIACPLCRAATKQVFAGHHAYRAPGNFDVQECSTCDTRFAWPLRAQPAIYETIYTHRKQLPGYDRYERFRQAVANDTDPLLVLATTEDVYWGVRSALEVVSAEATARGTGAPRVLELGSGMGYLTHALRCSGFEADGWDISSEAVAQATLQFGNHFTVVDVSEPFLPSAAGHVQGAWNTSGSARAYDAVIATELIEHLEDPQAFVCRAADLLAPGGQLILTTPNRDSYPPSMAWHTDPAPVHLWWFSKTSLRRMAWAAGLSIDFVDFGPFYGRRMPPATRSTKPQSFAEDGTVVFRDSAINTVARALMARWPAVTRHIGKIFLLQQSKRSHRERACHDSLSMCAVLRRTQA